MCIRDRAISGAKDILAERVSDNAQYRTYIRIATMREGTLQSTAKDEKAQTVYETYYNYEEPIRKAAGHRVLALNRGENEKALAVKVTAPEETILRYLEKQVIVRENPYTTPALKAVVQDSYERLIAPSIEREVRNELTEKAEEGAIKVFGKNLEQLLMQPPIVGRVVLGWDPAFRTGCKLAVVDGTGKVPVSYTHLQEQRHFAPERGRGRHGILRLVQHALPHVLPLGGAEGLQVRGAGLLRRR